MTEIRPSRRHIVRAGAWSVPVIAVAATAPAFATSGANLSTSSATARITNPISFDQRVETTIALKNTGTGPTASLTVSITITGDLRALNYPQSNAPAGWALTSVDTGQDTATFTRNAQLAAGSTENVVFTLRRVTSVNDEDVLVVITPGSGGTGRTLNVST